MPLSLRPLLASYLNFPPLRFTHFFLVTFYVFFAPSLLALTFASVRLSFSLTLVVELLIIVEFAARAATDASYASSHKLYLFNSRLCLPLPSFEAYFDALSFIALLPGLINCAINIPQVATVGIGVNLRADWPFAEGGINQPVVVVIGTLLRSSRAERLTRARDIEYWRGGAGRIWWRIRSLLYARREARRTARESEIAAASEQQSSDNLSGCSEPSVSSSSVASASTPTPPSPQARRRASHFGGLGQRRSSPLSSRASRPPSLPSLPSSSLPRPATVSSSPRSPPSLTATTSETMRGRTAAFVLIVAFLSALMWLSYFRTVAEQSGALLIFELDYTGVTGGIPISLVLTANPNLVSYTVHL